VSRFGPGLFRLRSFARACGGVAAIEFAFIAPILIFFYLGMAETCQLIMTQRRVSHAASALGDLVTQDTDIGSQEMLEIFEAGCTIMDPFVVGNSKFRVRITSAKRGPDTDPTIRVAWSENNGRGFADLANNDPVTVVTPLEAAGAAVVVTEVQYDYKSSVGFLMDTRLVKHRSEMRPRRSQEVLGPPAATGTTTMYCSN